jgi:hypothetical protein
MTKISTKYDTLGPLAVALGDAVGDELAIDNNIGMVQFYSNGAVFASPAGVCCVGCEILTIWSSLGGPDGPLGYPISDQCLAADGKGELVAFQGGFITWDPATGAVDTSGVQSGQPGVAIWPSSRSLSSRRAPRASARRPSTAPRSSRQSLLCL